MKVVESIAAWRSARKGFRPGSVGFVPTMGALHEILRASPTAAEAAQQLAAFGFDVDYVEDRPGRRFGAVKLGDVRLIDNMSHAAR